MPTNITTKLDLNLSKGNKSNSFDVTSSWTLLFDSTSTISESTELAIKLDANVTSVDARKQTASRQLQNRTNDGSRYAHSGLTSIAATSRIMRL
ncbi:unnamed protein product [Phytophthora lilii]|uniref:Unnamed protein product n=1 Tax=Phytophthora lilii TaxID=2077276 RepID=A0A9W7D7Y3_9STRA|nr:unnamed protein product [Phytophthora lilii]